MSYLVKKEINDWYIETPKKKSYEDLQSMRWRRKKNRAINGRQKVKVQYVMENHGLEGNLFSIEVQIDSIECSPRLTQWAFEQVHSWPKTWNTQDNNWPDY